MRIYIRKGRYKQESFFFLFSPGFFFQPVSQIFPILSLLIFATSFQPFLKIYSLLCNLSFTYPLFTAFLTLLSYLVIFKPLSISTHFQPYSLRPILPFPFKASSHSALRLPLLTKSFSFSISFFLFFFCRLFSWGAVFFFQGLPHCTILLRKEGTKKRLREKKNEQDGLPNSIELQV